MLDHLCHVLTRFLHSLHDHGRAELAAGSLDLSTAIDVATDGKTERAALRLMEEWHDRAVLDLPDLRWHFIRWQRSGGAPVVSRRVFGGIS